MRCLFKCNKQFHAPLQYCGAGSLSQNVKLNDNGENHGKHRSKH